MTRSYEIEAVVSATSQSTSKGAHRTTVTLLTDGGERLVLGLNGHAVARLKKYLGNALLPKSVEEGAAA